MYPWGSDLEPNGKHRCNIWQGNFPLTNTAEDGYEWTAPVRAFRKMDWGFYNMIGNLWEWTADWFSPTWHGTESVATRVNPQGPPTGENRVMKGGSFLCHTSYCNRYRLGARTANAPDSATTNFGFRCARNIYPSLPGVVWAVDSLWHALLREAPSVLASLKPTQSMRSSRPFCTTPSMLNRPLPDWDRNPLSGS